MRRVRYFIPLLLVAAAIAGLLHLRALPPETWFRQRDERLANTYGWMRLKAIEANGLEDYWTFDGPEWDGDGRQTTPHAGVRRVSGQSGLGLGFDGSSGCFYDTRHDWSISSNAFTMAFWLKEKRLPVNQDILCTWGWVRFGVRLVDGSMCFEWSTSGGVKSVSYKFTKYDEFVHIAVVNDPSTGMVSIYENGIRKDSSELADIDPFRWQVIVGLANQERARFPFHGVIDEIALWNRALPDGEIQRLSKTKRDLDAFFFERGERSRYLRKRARTKIMRAMAHTAMSGSFDFARIRRAKAATSRLRHVNVYVADDAWRRMARAHARSRRSKTTSNPPSGTVPAVASIDGVSSQCRISLGGGTLSYPHGERAPLVIEPADLFETLPGGQRRVELLPPESSGWLAHLAISEIHRTLDIGPGMRRDCEAVALSVNGVRRGVYLMRDMTHMGTTSSDSTRPWRYRDVAQPFTQMRAELASLRPAAPDEAALSLVPFLRHEEIESIKERLAVAADIIWNDPFSPLPRKLRDERIRTSLNVCTDRIDSRRQGVPPLFEALLFGRNLAAWRVVEDLDFGWFARRLPEKWSVSFKSDNESVVASDGKVTRPDGDPAFAQVAVTLVSPAGDKKEREFSFRVMPKNASMPSVFVWTATPFGRTHRTAATVQIFDPTQDAKCQFLSAASSGGIRYRGNSTFASKKKLLNIKVDTPHHFLGSTETRSLLCINAYTDPLRICSSLSFGLYRSLPAGPEHSPHFAPHVRHAELFVNGAYRYLVEFAERVDADMLGNQNCVILRHTVSWPRNPVMRQSYPPLAEYDGMGVYLGLERLLEANADGSHTAEVEARLDMTSIIDHMLFLSLFANANGWPNNRWFQEDVVYDLTTGKFSYVPWDYDCPMSSHGYGVIETDLDRMLLKYDPAHRRRVAARWKELRGGVLETSRVIRLYDELLSGHLAYLPTESRKWDAKGNVKDKDHFVGLRDQGRKFLRTQLGLLDGIFAEWERTDVQ